MMKPFLLILLAVVVLVSFVVGMCLLMESAGGAQAGVTYTTTTLYNVEHDGHLFVLFDAPYKGGIMHHPDCECLNVD